MTDDHDANEYEDCERLYTLAERDVRQASVSVSVSVSPLPLPQSSSSSSAQQQEQFQSKTMYWLPDELWTFIMTFLEFKTKMKMVTVAKCFAWDTPLMSQSLSPKRDVLKWTIQTLKLKTVMQWRERFPSRVCFFVQLPNNQKYTLHLQSLCSFMNKVHIYYTQISDSFLKYVEHCDEIVFMDCLLLRNVSELANVRQLTFMNGQDIDNISSLVGVEKLILQNTRVNSFAPLVCLKELIWNDHRNSTLVIPDTLNSLERLCIEQFGQTAMVEFVSLASLQSLTDLKLCCSCSMRSSSKNMIPALHNLVDLNVRDSNITEISRDLPLLKHLKLLYCSCIRTIPCFATLMTLDVSYSSIENISGTYPSLSHLCANGTEKLTSIDGYFPVLVELILDHSNVEMIHSSRRRHQNDQNNNTHENVIVSASHSDAPIQSQIGCSSSLFDAPIRSSSLFSSISNFPKLKRLHLNSVAHVRSLHIFDFPVLEFLDISKTKNITYLVDPHQNEEVDHMAGFALKTILANNSMLMEIPPLPRLNELVWPTTTTTTTTTQWIWPIDLTKWPKLNYIRIGPSNFYDRNGNVLSPIEVRNLYMNNDGIVQIKSK